MYFIVNGDCLVIIKEHDRKSKIARLLYDGQHFGEIGLLYGCDRTASIMSRNYNTLAKLNRNDLYLLNQTQPLFKEYLYEHIFKYNYRKKSFIQDTF